MHDARPTGAHADREHGNRPRGSITRYWPLLALFLGLVSPLVFSTWYSFDKQRSILENTLQTELKQITTLLAHGMREPIWNLTPALGQPLMDSLMDDADVVAIEVTSLVQGDFLQTRRATAPAVTPLRFDAPVTRGGVPIGEVVVEMDPSDIERQMAQQWPEIYALGVMQALLGSGVVIFVYVALRRQERAQALQDMNQRLTAEVKSRTDDLEQAHAELLRTESLAVLGRLTATVSHELRNPLGTIDTSLSTVAQLLERDGGVTESNAATITRALERARRNIARCSRITDELLGFTQRDGGTRQPTQVDRWLEETVADYDLPDGISVDLQLASGATLDIDRERLRRALTNLFGNAVQAMTDDEGVGGRRVLGIHSRIRGSRLEIRVSDTGTGIAPEVRDRIFEPLFSTRAFGFGLGLPFVREVVERQHGGGVELLDVDSGAEFLIWLPLPEADDSTGHS